MAVNTLVQLPFNTGQIGDEDERVDLDLDLLNNANDDINDRYDQSILNDIDPDINYIHDQNNTQSLYYCEKTFNEKYNETSQLSFLNCNVRSIPHNFKDLNLYLENLKHSFTIIGVTESWLTPYNVNNYTPNIITMSMTQEIRKGGRVFLCL